MAVLSIAALKSQLNSQITTNGVNAITGAILNGNLIDTVDSLQAAYSGAYLPLVGGVMMGDTSLNNGVVIKALNGGGQLNTRAGSDGTVDLTTDNGAYTVDSAWHFISQGSSNQLGYQLVYGSEAMGLGIFSSGSTPTAGTAKDIVITDNRTVAALSGNLDKRAISVGSRSSEIGIGLVNTVIVSGDDVIATKSNALYANKLILQSAANAFDGIFDVGTLTAERTYTLPDADMNFDTALTEVLTFGGGASGEVATLTLANGLITAKTLVP